LCVSFCCTGFLEVCRTLRNHKVIRSKVRYLAALKRKGGSKKHQLDSCDGRL
jgi:hypothetical protein